MTTDALKQLWMLTFGDSAEFVDLFFATAYDPRRCRFLSNGELPTAALYWLDTEYLGQKFAYIYGVATHPDHRNQGLCRKLMQKTHEALHQQGYAGALLMPAKPGLRQMYGKMGYRECSRLREFDCTAESTVAVHAIDKEEYARLRREFLPEGGVIQEGENLDYLLTYAQVYRGDDFLLAAVHEDGHLYGMELLGNREAAGGILAALGCKSGSFRCPGREIPFGMFLPLAENAAEPGYLGLVFD